jgi:hypothetical protein
MTATSSGNVGIGTSSPAYRFQVNPGDNQLAVFNESGTWTANGGLVLADYYAATTLIGGIKISASTATSGYVTFHTGGTTERGRFDAGGNFLVGTATPTGNAWGAPGIVVGSGYTVQIQATGYSTYGMLNYQGNLFWNNGADRMRLDPNGYLSVLGIYNLTTGAGANVHVAADGTLYRSTSSLKYKTDVQDAAHGLSQVMSLRPVTYKGVNDGETVFGGLIAEEVHEAGLTEFVQYAEDGTPDALAYANMVSLAFKAIQEQQAIITAQNTTINALTARVEALENK